MGPEELLWKGPHYVLDRLDQTARILFDVGHRVTGALHGNLILDFDAMRAPAGLAYANQHRETLSVRGGEYRPGQIREAAPNRRDVAGGGRQAHRRPPDHFHS